MFVMFVCQNCCLLLWFDYITRILGLTADCLGLTAYCFLLRVSTIFLTIFKVSVSVRRIINSISVHFCDVNGKYVRNRVMIMFVPEASLPVSIALAIGGV